MKRVACIFGVTVLWAVALVAAHDIPPSLAQGRDLSKYDDGGVYRGHESIADVQRLREFIWAHWTQKRRGYVEVVSEGIDSGTAAYLFIEPTDEGWGINWDEIYSGFPGSNVMRPSSTPTIVTVERCRGYLIFFDAYDRIVKYL